MGRLWLILLLLMLTGQAQAASFIIGVPPVHSMRTLVQRYEPLRAYLEVQLGRPVHVESAQDFVEYHARTLRGDFDLTITPAHLARLGQKDKGFQPLAQFKPDHDILLVTSVDRPLKHMGLLRGQQLAVIDRLAINSMAAQHHLEELGLEAGRDYRVVEYRNHGSVGQALTSGLAMAGVTTTQGLQQMPDPVRDKLKIQTHIADIPAFVMLARPDVPRGEVDRLQGALMRFTADKAGQDFLKGLAYTDLVPADERMMKRADIYLKETRKGLMP